MKPNGKDTFRMAGKPTVKAKQRLWVEGLIARNDAIGADLRVLLQQLHNRPPVSRAPASSKRLTPAKRAAVRREHEANPRMSQMRIAAKHDLNSGRVSETLAGKRK